MTDNRDVPGNDSGARHAAFCARAKGEHTAFRVFNDSVFTDGALPTKTKQLIAVAAAHITQCPYCIRGHTRAALKAGATREEIMEAIWVAADMRAGARTRIRRSRYV